MRKMKAQKLGNLPLVKLLLDREAGIPRDNVCKLPPMAQSLSECYLILSLLSVSLTLI